MGQGSGAAEASRHDRTRNRRDAGVLAGCPSGRRADRGTACDLPRDTPRRGFSRTWLGNVLAVTIHNAPVCRPCDRGADPCDRVREFGESHGDSRSE